MTLVCTPPCGCCAWSIATGTVMAGGSTTTTTFEVTATGPDHFSTNQTGLAGQSSDGTIIIDWTHGNPRTWVNWEKQSNPFGMGHYRPIASDAASGLHRHATPR